MSSTIQELTPYERSGEIARAMALMGMSHRDLGGYVDMIRDAHGKSRMLADLRRYVEGPIVVHAMHGERIEGSGHPLNDTYRHAIYAERAMIGLGLSPWTVGPVEIAMVTYFVTLQAPPHRDLGEVYSWSCCYAALALDTRKTIDEVRARFSDPRLPTDQDILTREPWKTVYRDLSAAIRRKVVGHARADERSDVPSIHMAALPVLSAVAAE